MEKLLIPLNSNSGNIDITKLPDKFTFIPAEKEDKIKVPK